MEFDEEVFNTALNSVRDFHPYVSEVKARTLVKSLIKIHHANKMAGRNLTIQMVRKNAMNSINYTTNHYAGYSQLMITYMSKASAKARA